MKNLAFTLLLAFFTISSQAQNANIDVQAAKNNIEWLETHSAEFATIVADLQKAFDEKNSNIASESKARMMKILLESTNTTQSLSRMLKNRVEGTFQSRPGDIVEVDNAEAKAADVHECMVALQFTEDEAIDFSDSAITMEKIQKTLRANSFQVHPDQENTEANIALLNKYSSLLNNATEMFQLANSRT